MDKKCIHILVMGVLLMCNYLVTNGKLSLLVFFTSVIAHGISFPPIINFVCFNTTIFPDLQLKMGGGPFFCSVTP